MEKSEHISMRTLATSYINKGQKALSWFSHMKNHRANKAIRQTVSVTFVRELSSSVYGKLRFLTILRF